MLAVTDPTVKKITVMSCTQLLKTELLNNIVGFFVDQDPSPIILMQPTVKSAETWSKDRLDKMIRDTPVLKVKFYVKKSRDTSNTILHKSFTGGHVTMIGSNAPSDLAQRPVRIILCDEIDKYPISAGDEGDPIKLITERSDTFWNALVVQVCSPTIEGLSRINDEYNLGDKRVYEVPCPHCNFKEEMKWPNVKWTDKKGDDAQYFCGECGEAWHEHERLQAIEKGTWRATAEFRGHASFRVNKLSSPWQPMSILAEKFLEAKDKPELLKTFVNTQLAETWKEIGDAPEWKRIYSRREDFEIDTVSEGAIFLTMGVDVQQDRLEATVVGWGRNKVNWTIAHRVMVGTTDNIDSACWNDLTDLINETFHCKTDDVFLPIRLTAIDTGYNTQTVYNFCRKFSHRQVIPVKGQETQQSSIGKPRSVDVTTRGIIIKNGLKLWPVGVNLIKSELYGWLKQEFPAENEQFAHGFCHFPQFNEEFFKQLTAEQMVVKVVKGYKKYQWIKTRARNEILDCMVYNRACSAALGIDRFQEKHWQKMEIERGSVIHKPKVSTPANTPKKQRRSRRRESGFL